MDKNVACPQSQLCQNFGCKLPTAVCPALRLLLPKQSASNSLLGRRSGAFSEPSSLFFSCLSGMSGVRMESTGVLTTSTLLWCQIVS